MGAGCGGPSPEPAPRAQAELRGCPDPKPAPVSVHCFSSSLKKQFLRFPFRGIKKRELELLGQKDSVSENRILE